jgi:mono/diheme cytochrome c family protein
MGAVYLRLSAWWAAAGLALASVATLPTAGVAAAGFPVDYASQVKPILTRHCVSCHGATKPKGGLRLDTAAAALLGGESGPVVLPGRGEESPIVAAVRGEGETERMPLKRPPLAEAEIKLLSDWIDQGAKAIAGERPGIPSH